MRIPFTNVSCEVLLSFQNKRIFDYIIEKFVFLKQPVCNFEEFSVNKKYESSFSVSDLEFKNMLLYSEKK